ncbi:MAG: hypothetical protein P4L55_09215 [Syntrophobacteraceae bacterium]|nr:hypothetical protein [Syntrophobacteraceae bacterium]
MKLGQAISFLMGGQGGPWEVRSPLPSRRIARDYCFSCTGPNCPDALLVHNMPIVIFVLFMIAPNVSALILLADHSILWGLLIAIKLAGGMLFLAFYGDALWARQLVLLMD